MIDWLRRSPADLVVRVGERDLPVAIRRHPRAGRLVMRLAPDGSEVRVTLPNWGRTEDALVFARARLDWLERQLAAVPQATAPCPGGTIRYRGGELTIDWHPAHPRKPRAEGDSLRIGGPAENLVARVQRWLESEARRLAGELSHGQKQRLEIGMLLMQQPALLLLDEPAAGMTDDETMELAVLLNKLRGTCSMMVVEHDMEFVAALAGDAGRVTVMAEGHVLAHGALDEVKRDDAVVESYLGR